MLGERIERARLAAGLSLRSLGEAVGLSHAAIQKYETGQSVPSSGVLLRLAEVLGVRTEYFFRPTTLVMEGVSFRKRAGLTKKREDSIRFDVMDKVERRVELEGLFPTPPVSQFKIIESLPDTVTSLDQVETIAESVRDAWGLGLDPIPELLDLLESHGLRVFQLELDGDQKFDGLAGNVNGFPIVVVGTHWPGDRQRFTLAHELGHCMLNGRIDTDIDEESACNRFAGAFLIPKQQVIKKLGFNRTRIEPRELYLLKHEFGISMQALLHRARDLDILSYDRYVGHRKFFNMKGWSRVEPGDQYPPEKSKIFDQMIFRALAEDYIGESKAAEFLNIPLNQFRSLRDMDAIDAASYQ